MKIPVLNGTNETSETSETRGIIYFTTAQHLITLKSQHKLSLL
jgi:hypothetical protein